MRKIASVVVLLVVASLFAAAPSASAIESGKKYSSCKQLNKKYKNGVALSKYFAKRAVEKGYLRPKVNSKIYWKNEERLEASGNTGFLCPRTPPPPALNEPSAVANLVVTPGSPSYRGDSPDLDVCFEPPGLGNERGDAVYDIYLDGQLYREGVPNYLSGKSTPTCTGNYPSSVVTIRPLAGGTTYTVGVRARNERGTGPLIEATAATLPQEAFDRYGQTLITYEVSGSGGNYSYTIETSSGGTSQGYTGNGTFYEDWFTKDKFVYVSLQNQNSSGSVTCTIKRNGVVYKTTTSDGAYVIATCSGRS